MASFCRRGVYWARRRTLRRGRVVSRGVPPHLPINGGRPRASAARRRSAARAAWPWNRMGPSSPVVQAAGPASRPPQGSACEVRSSTAPIQPRPAHLDRGPMSAQSEEHLLAHSVRSPSPLGAPIHTTRPQLETSDQGKVAACDMGSRRSGRGPAPSDWLPGAAARLGGRVRARRGGAPGRV